MKATPFCLALLAGVLTTPESAFGQADAEIISREKGAVQAWQQKNKAYWTDYLAKDATYFGPYSPYRDDNPQETFLPNFEKYVEMYQILDFQMYNPRVQMFGNVAVLTYDEAVTSNMAGTVMNYTGKVTAVFVREGGTWKIVHGHESLNPGME
jgi:ketosteroid isomerase-like protein